MRPMATRPLVVTALLTAFVIAPIRGAGQPPGQDPALPSIVAQGSGEVRAVPDMAVIAIGAEQPAKTPKEAQAAVAKAMTAVQQRLVAAGVAKEAIRTTAFDVQAQFDYVNGKQIPRGFLARHHIDVRVDDVSRVGELLDVAIQAGGTSVQGVRFDLKERPALEREALKRAVADARARADAMAAGAGSTVASVLRIEEGARVGAPQPAMMRMSEAITVSGAPDVTPGETVIRANVTLTARLK